MMQKGTKNKADQEHNVPNKEQAVQSKEYSDPSKEHTVSIKGQAVQTKEHSDSTKEIIDKTDNNEQGEEVSTNNLSVCPSLCVLPNY